MYSGPDVDFRTMCRLLQEVELFLTVRHGVKHGDIGLLRRLVDPLAVVFFGASQHNYGREMLFYRWNWSSANTPTLQRAILASGLVNWPGRSSTFKPIDLCLEHPNCSCKLDLKHNKNLTHDLEVIFQRTSLCNATVQCVRESLESFFWEHMPGTHSSASASADMFLLARTLVANDLTEPRNIGLLANARMFDSHDIKQSGMDILEQRVDLFNELHVQKPGVPDASVLPISLEEIGDFPDISAYAAAIPPLYDAETCATIDLT